MIWISPSQHASFKGCNRKWAFRYIDGIKIPPKKEQQFGTEGHSRNESYLRRGQHVGDDDVGLVCQQGIKPGYMPTPSSELLIEKKFELVILKGQAKMIGYIDCVAPPKTVGGAKTLPVVCDWKFTKDLRWAMTPAELVEDSQAAVYSYWAHRVYNADKVMVRWVYFCGRVNAKSEDGRPRTPRGVKKVELVFDADMILANWNRELEISRAIVATKAQYQKAVDVPPNELHCDAYGGCDYRDRCPLEGETFLGAMLEQWERTHSGPIDSQPTPQEGEMSEDLLAKLKAHKQDVAAQKAALPTETQPAAEAAPPPPAPPASAEVIDAVPEYVEDSPPPPAEPAAEAPPPVADPGADLLARLQAAQGAKGLNPPEGATEPPPPAETPPAATPPPPAETKAADPSVVVAKTEAPAATPPPAEAAPPAETKAEPVARSSKKSKTTNGKAPFVVAIDAVAAKVANGALGEVVHLSEFIEPIAKAIAKGHRCEEHPTGVDHWNLIEFGQGPSILANQVAAQLDKKRFSGVLVVDGSTLEGRALKDVLIRRADVVFRGVR